MVGFKGVTPKRKEAKRTKGAKSDQVQRDFIYEHLTFLKGYVFNLPLELKTNLSRLRPDVAELQVSNKRRVLLIRYKLICSFYSLLKNPSLYYSNNKVIFLFPNTIQSRLVIRYKQIIKYYQIWNLQ